MLADNTLPTIEDPPVDLADVRREQGPNMVLRENVEHHIQEEEREMFKKIEKIDKERLARMAEDWNSRKGVTKAFQPA